MVGEPAIWHSSSVGTEAYPGASVTDSVTEIQTMSGVAGQLLAADDPRQQRISALQQRLREDAQNGYDWFELGQAYMFADEFDSAGIAFGYALRLLGARGEIYSAQASALYYQQRQRISEEVMSLVEKALEMDPYDSTALMLLATDHFEQQRYQQAILQWQKMLFAERSELDREAIMESINTARLLQSRKAK